MGNHKKKKKNADFQKVKLKIGKKLARSNDTRTDFRARKVILLEQLKNGASSTTISKSEDVTFVSRRNLNIQQICQRLRHHNVNVRNDAAQSVKEFIMRQNYDQLKLHLKSILENLCLLITDLDSDVRSSMYAGLKEILQKVKPLDVSPSFRLVTAHVICGSTHLNPSVKMFAVKLIDLLTDKLPDLCRNDRRLLKAYADLLNFGDKTITRNYKSAFANGLWRITKVNYEIQEDNSVLKDSAGNATTDVNIINPRNCSLTADCQIRFESPLFSYDLSSQLQKECIIDPLEYAYVTKKAVSFCHAFWLEITTPDRGSRPISGNNAGDQSWSRSFDGETLTDMSNIANIYYTILMRAKKGVEAVDINEKEASVFRQVLESYFESESFLKRYADVFPCQLKRTSSHKNDTYDTCVELNLCLAGILSQNSNYRTKISDYLTKLRQKRSLNQKQAKKESEILKFCELKAVDKHT